MTETTNPPDISLILKAFETFDGQYKRYEVEEAVKQQTAITPYLLEILEKILEDPEYCAREQDRFDYCYTIMLLWHFKEVQAHETIIKLSGLPGELPFELFGDTVTEDLDNILYATSGGNMERIMDLVLNEKANEYCRSAAMGALTMFVVFENVQRSEIIRFLEDFFPKLLSEKNTSSLLFDTFARVAQCIYPEELLEILNKSYDEDLIETFFSSRDEITAALELGKEKTLEKTRLRLEKRSRANVHDKISWWACFQSDNRYTASGQKILKTVAEKNRAKRNRKKKKKK